MGIARLAWDPQQYLKFAGARMQPGLDLIARIPDFAASRIVDLGCGTGHLTSLLARRWPSAQVVGLDQSAEMLAIAVKDLSGADWPSLHWRREQIAGWAASEPLDLIFSNAALHWLDDHETLFPHLVDQLKPGGVLALQMPRNFDQPSHRQLRSLAAEEPWAECITLRQAPVLSPEQYYDLLAPRVASLQIWETDYLHVLTGDRPVLDWLRGTALLPVLEALDGDELESFLNRYAEQLAQAYPKRADGQTLFPFRRLFLLAVRP